MKKGISLIVLVITIIVMIIIAGAIIISLNSTNIINEADRAVLSSDAANLKSELTLKYAEVVLENQKDGDDTNDMDKAGIQEEYDAILEKYDRLVEAGYTVTAGDDLEYTVNEPTPAQ